MSTTPPDPKSLLVNDDRVLAELQKMNAQLRALMQSSENMQKLSIEQQRHAVPDWLVGMIACGMLFAAFGLAPTNSTASVILVIAAFVFINHASKSLPTVEQDPKHLTPPPPTR